ncbi:MAG: glycosyl transferase, family 2 [Thermoleophilia bacterium]|jgi:glycosyltransferase involved in cell wall biosynthesis|nr:glycosyl transferase, family 2 [Thermoleophilia bacterium]
MMLVRDRADLLPAAAASVLAQEGVDLDLVILDDGSRDETWRVATDIAARDDRVRLMRNEVSVGIPTARNQVLAVASGEFVAITDSDDLSRPGRFAAQLEMLRADDGLVGAGGKISAFTDDPASGTVPTWHWGLRDGRLPFAFPTGMFRIDALRAAGGFDERWPVAEDLQLAYRLVAAGGRFAAVSTIVLDYRQHAGSSSAKALRHEWYTLRAQLFGLRALRGRLSVRGYLVVIQSALRVMGRWLRTLGRRPGVL